MNRISFRILFQELKFALKIFNFFFTSVFILEAAMKIVALGFYRYIKDRWVLSPWYIKIVDAKNF